MKETHEHFELEFRDGYIDIQLSPEYESTPEQQNEFWAAIAAACGKHKCNRVLLEGYVPKQTPGTLDVVSSGVRAAEAVPDLWLALCLKDYNEVTELGELFKTVARSRGVHVKFFSEL